MLSSICGDKGKRAQTYIVHVFYICIALFYRIYITLIKKKKKKTCTLYVCARLESLDYFFFYSNLFFFLICWKLSTMLLHRKKK